MGLLLLSAGAVLAVPAAVEVASKPLVAVVFTLTGTRFILSGSYELGASQDIRIAAGVIGLLLAGAAVYCAAAFALEDAHARPALPTLRRGHPQGRRKTSPGHPSTSRPTRPDDATQTRSDDD